MQGEQQPPLTQVDRDPNKMFDFRMLTGKEEKHAAKALAQHCAANVTHKGHVCQFTTGLLIKTQVYREGLSPAPHITLSSAMQARKKQKLAPA